MICNTASLSVKRALSPDFEWWCPQGAKRKFPCFLLFSVFCVLPFLIAVPTGHITNPNRPPSVLPLRLEKQLHDFFVGVLHVAFLINCVRPMFRGGFW